MLGIGPGELLFICLGGGATLAILGAVVYVAARLANR